MLEADGEFDAAIATNLTNATNITIAEAKCWKEPDNETDFGLSILLSTLIPLFKLVSEVMCATPHSRVQLKSTTLSSLSPNCNVLISPGLLVIDCRRKNCPFKSKYTLSTTCWRLRVPMLFADRGHLFDVSH